jgi:hypothetical protein
VSQESADGKTPRAAYAERLAERQRRNAELARRERLVGNARVGLFLLMLLLGWLAFGAHALSGWWLAPPLAAFVALLFAHEQVTRAWYLARRAVAFYRAGLARLDNQWKGKGQQGTRFLREDHPYAADLDLFGPGSLFELLSTARTRSGEDTLAGWLLAPAGPEEVRARQEAVAELRPMLDLREDLALLGADVAAGVDFDVVAAWGAAAPVLVRRWPRWVALGLGLVTTAALAGWLLDSFGALDPDGPAGQFFGTWGSLPFAIALPVQLAFAGLHLRRVAQVIKAVERRAHDLALLANVLKRLEQATFASPRLCELRAALDAGDDPAPPSQRIARLGNLVDLLESRRNQFFAPFAYLLMVGTQTAYAIEAWRARSGKAVAEWLRVVGEFEALCALAAYAYENPADPFPEVVPGGPLYEGEGLGHPLLPPPTMVRNDLRLSDDLRVLVVSGSNMSGKSTFLRTAGVNAVLAMAGAPVRARRLRLSPLAVGATLRVQDSLQEGRSRFYAEILRVRQVVELTRGPLPLLFLLDEIFAGTNSHDRRLGAEAVVRGLVEAGAVGLVTTHDLSLTHIAEGLAPRAANVHFSDHFENGVMMFDYRVHPGVVQNSNALALMRAVGLRV